jgi:hypothetical protein
MLFNLIQCPGRLIINIDVTIRDSPLISEMINNNINNIQKPLDLSRGVKNSYHQVSFAISPLIVVFTCQYCPDL